MANSPVRRFFGDFRSRYLLFPALLLVGASILTGCKPAITDPKDPKFVVAEKGNWKISRAELDTEVSGFLKGHNATADQVGPSKMPMVETMMLKNMVLKKLILDQAATLPMTDIDKDEAAQLEVIKSKLPPGHDLDTELKASNMTLDDLKKQIHEQTVIRKVLEANAFKNVDPTEQQIDAIYTKYKDQFTIPAKVRASRILVLVDDKTSPADKVAKKKKIDAAHARVAKGEDFSKVAMEVSEDKYSAPKGGDINFFQKGENEPGFDDVAFNTKEGAVSPVFQTSLGYQFIKVTASQPAGLIPVADARNFISQKLKDQNMQAQSQAYAKKLLTDSNVTYHLLLVDPPAQDGPGGPGAGPGPGPDAAGGAMPPPSGPDASAPPEAAQPPPAGPAPAPEAAPAPAQAPTPSTPSK
jgi:hypothetical protein